MMIARIFLLSLCLALVACTDPQQSIGGTVGYSRLDECRFVLEPGGNSDGFQPFVVIKDTPKCLHPEKLSGQPVGHGESYPEAEPPHVVNPCKENPKLSWCGS